MAQEDPRQAVGGLWNEIGHLQLRTLKRAGLQPHHRFLDVGAGCLRGGVHLIRYLEPGNYWGTELSPRLLDVGRSYLAEAGLVARRPHLKVTQDFSFRELEGITFHYALAFGVFTDIPAESIRECFSNVGKVMAPGGQFLATFGLNDRHVSDPVHLQFRYHWSLFEQIGRDLGISVSLVRGFRHPKGHSLLIARWPIASHTQPIGCV